MKQNAIELNNVWKRYGSTVALRGVSFSVRAGEIFALLGPNGAGKTTALACMEGLLRPDSGSVSVLGQIPTRDRRRLNRHIGVQLQAGALPDHMRVDEAMKLFAATIVLSTHDMAEAESLADHVVILL